MERLNSGPIVYLDNADYSRLADALGGHGHHHLANVYEQLVKAARDGRATFCFSYMIACEAFQLASGHVEIASRKAQVIESLCGSRAFPNPVWLLRLELIKRATLLGFSCGAEGTLLRPIVENGLWVLQDFPSAETELDKLKLFSRKNLEAAAAEQGMPTLNRRARRGLKASFTSKLASSKNALRAEIEKLHTCKVLFELGQEKMVWDMLAGRAGVGDLTRKLAEDIGRPTTLVKVHQHIHDLSWLNDIVTKFNTSIKIALDKLLEAMWSWPDSYRPKDLVAFRKLASVHVDRMVLGLARGLEKYFLAGGIDQGFLSSAHFDHAVLSSRFSQVLKAILIRLLWTVFCAGQDSEGIEASHGGDILHAVYLPYCQFWRTDRAFSNIAAQVGKEFECTVVNRLEDLPSLLGS